MKVNRTAANFAGLLAWRQFRAFLMRTVAGPSRGVAQRWSDRPQWPAHTLNPPYSRAAATAYNLAVPKKLEPAIRLPEHEVRGECDLQRVAAGLGLTRKTSVHCVPDKMVTRGRPEEPSSTVSGVWKNCSSNSRR